MKLSNINLNRKINVMKNVVRQAEVELSYGCSIDVLHRTHTTLITTFNSIKEHFYTGEYITTPDGKKYPVWNGDAFDKALNNRHPGLSFRMNSVIDALEKIYM